MPQVHNQLERGPWGVAVKAVLGDTRSEGTVERFGETMQPILDLWLREEFAYLRREFLFAIRLQRAADAANAGIVGMSLPASIRAIAGIWASGANSTAGGSLSLMTVDRASVAALGGFSISGPAQQRDQRWWQTASGAGINNPPFIEAFSALYGGALPFNTRVEQLNFPTTEMQPFRSSPYILRPGGAIAIETEAINQIITCNFWGWVRVPMPGELVAP